MNRPYDPVIAGAAGAERRLTFGSLFSGIGGLDLGLEWAGLSCRWQVENNPDRLAVLEKRWPSVRRYTDVQEVRWDEVDPVDVVVGGFPCQDISSAGLKVGITGRRSGLWKSMAAAIRDLRPRYVVVENVADLAVRGLDVVLGDLHLLGFDAEWSALPACALGAPHARRRLFVVAYRPGDDEQGQGPHHALSHRGHPDWARQPRRSGGALGRGQRWLPEPAVGRVAHGVPVRVVGPQLGGLGNSVAPPVGEWIGRLLLDAEASRASEAAA